MKRSLFAGLFSGVTRRNRRPRSLKLTVASHFEPLEQRALLAGDVAAIVMDGDLMLDGDIESNSIQVLVVNGDVVVRGLDDTTVNGGTADFVAFAGTDTVPNNVKIRTRSGDDVIVLSNNLTIAKDVLVYAGFGDDSIGLDNVSIGRNIRVRGARGTDSISVDSTEIGNSARLNTNTGDDTVNVVDSNIANELFIDLGNGDNALVINGANIGGLTRIIGQNGIDDLLIQDSALDGRLFVQTHGNSDFVILSGTTVVAKRVNIRNGNGNDSVLFDATTRFERRVTVRARQGVDTVELDENAVAVRKFRAKGAESDTVQDTVRDDQLNNATTGILTRINAAQATFDEILLPLTVDLSSNDGSDQDGTFVTDSDTLSIVGTTGNLATVELDTNGDGLFDNGTTTAGDTGTFAINVPLVLGTTTITVRSTGTRGQIATESILVERREALLTIDLTGNTTEQSLGTLITKQSTLAVAGTTLSGATVDIDRDGDGEFDDGTATAAADGTYSVNVTLLPGANALQVRATDGALQDTQQIEIYRAEGSVTRFASSLGNVDVELFDTRHPNTIANFQSYIDAGRYVDSIVHRSPANFVVQGGGFALDGNTVNSVPTFAPILNEFLAEDSNVRGTLSMAQLGGNINSGTSQWFFNVVDNLSLDAVPHTVFGVVIGDGMDVVDAINDLSIFNLQLPEIGQSALSETPLQNYQAFTQDLTGTVTISPGGNTLNGVGTQFTQELVTGSSIRIGSEIVTVSVISNDTQLFLSGSHAAGATNATAQRNAVPDAGNYVVFSDISEILDTV